MLEPVALSILVGAVLGFVCGRISIRLVRLGTAGGLGLLAGLTVYGFGLVNAVLGAFPMRGATAMSLRVSVPGLPLAVIFTTLMIVVVRWGLVRFGMADRYPRGQAVFVGALAAPVTVLCRPWVIPIY